MHISEATNLFIFSDTAIHKKRGFTVFNYNYKPLIGINMSINPHRWN